MRPARRQATKHVAQREWLAYQQPTDDVKYGRDKIKIRSRHVLRLLIFCMTQQSVKNQ